MARARRSRPLRGQVRAAILAATAGALLVFAVPLAIALRTAYVEQAETVLQREAAAVHAAGDRRVGSADPTRPRRRPTRPSDSRSTAPTGPGPAAPAGTAPRSRRASRSSGGERTYSEGDMLAAYLPVGDEGASRSR